MGKKTDTGKEITTPSLDEVQAEHKRLRYLSRFRRTILGTVAVLLVAAAAATLVATLWMPVLRIYGTSMTPTLQDGQIVAAVKTSGLETGEIVAFYYGSKILVKRVIAGPGDWVEIDNTGLITVNGEPLAEPYASSKALGECDVQFPYQVPDGHWFLVGDNRAESIDSRLTQVGSVSEDMIIGRIVFRVWPLAAAGRI